MDSLIAASESFYDNSKEEEVNVELFNSFMKCITIWNYSCITREHSLLLPNQEKEVLLKKNTIRTWKAGRVVRFYYFLLRLKLSKMFFVNYFARWERVKKLLADAEIDVRKVFWYCKYCKKCERFYSIRSEFKKKGFSTFNKGNKYWNVTDHEQFEIRPVRDHRLWM